ncbi:DUF6580 family putative transport protein [Pedobacter sp. Hv1]|uniref:DUF6580 family putative transport protein n=1 Tax=Pedobacter sp. Hv1 TaxID=1740090 RepID=UPI0006D8A22F|nr:DUF6580 family putative transport protein [Pedobacter sp. Hv1]KQC00991.1 hypothetical protein AQF98_09985 [Pedobacter sp. Hv1]
MENKSNYRTPVLLLFMLLIVGLRVIAPLSPDFKLIANFSGIGAVALFGGAYFKNNISAFLLPVLVLLISDLGLAATMGIDYGFYQGWYYTYIAFILMVLVGKLIVNKVNVPNVLGAGLAAVLIHWIVSDFGVWFGSTFYPQTIAGFWACLVAAIPFELKFLYGTLGYSALMFGIFEGLKAKYPALSLSRTV